MPATILTANSSSILVDGDPVEGLQSIAFRHIREQHDVMAIGTDQRIGVAYGASRVSGRLVVASSAPQLAALLQEGKAFQLVVNLAKPAGSGEGSQTVTFNACQLANQEFSLTSNGTGLTTYEFTAASVGIE